VGGNVDYILPPLVFHDDLGHRTFHERNTEL